MDSVLASFGSKPIRHFWGHNSFQAKLVISFSREGGPYTPRTVLLNSIQKSANALFASMAKINVLKYAKKKIPPVPIFVIARFFQF